MNIVLATDNNFVQHCCVTITSILCNNENVDIFIITEGLSAENENILRTQTEKYDGRFHIALVDKAVIAKLPMPKTAAQHISPATYYRLFVAEILPDTIDRLIYLDCDIVVRGSLAGYWNVDLTGKPLAAVYQHNSWAANAYKGKMSVYARLGMKDSKGYFNAGSLLINLKYWREHDVQKKLLDFMEAHYDCIVNHDQDILNACLYKQVLPVSDIWNFRFPMKPEYYGDKYLSKDDIDGITQSAIVVHYVNRPKPWEYACSHPYVREYYKYLDMTPFSGWRPVFNYMNIYQYHIRVWLVNVKHFFDKMLGVGRYNPKNYE